MKEPRLSYSIVILAITGIFVAFIGYAIDTPIASKVKQHPMKTVASAKATTSTASVTPAKTTTTDTITEKFCGCCAERKTFTRKRIQQARERRLATQSAATDNAATQE